MEHDTVGRPMEILLVEDSVTFARITMATLRKGHVACHLTWLADGEDALDFVHRRAKFVRAPRPDLILLDLGLPKIDGRDVLAEIKSDDDLRAIPVVILTGSLSEADRLESERLDVDAFLTKPVDLERFLGLVKELRSVWHEHMLVPARTPAPAISRSPSPALASPNGCAVPPRNPTLDRKSAVRSSRPQARA